MEMIEDDDDDGALRWRWLLMMEDKEYDRGLQRWCQRPSTTTVVEDDGDGDDDDDDDDDGLVT